jgi:hypothetical protein
VNDKKKRELEKLARKMAKTKVNSKEWTQLFDKIDKLLGIEPVETDKELDGEWELQRKP